MSTSVSTQITDPNDISYTHNRPGHGRPACTRYPCAHSTRGLVAPAPPATNWDARAYRWRKRGTSHGWLDAIANVSLIHTQDLQHIERQTEIIDRNTRHFIEGKPANNVLMTGARGTGKSSLVKAMLAAYGDRGLRLIEVDKSDLGDLADIVDLVAKRPEKFIVFVTTCLSKKASPATKP